jgi:hypothetical protein
MSWNAMLMATAVAANDTVLLEDEPDVVEITGDDARDIRMLVRDQLAAFRAGDAARAYGLCSSGIHETFSTPEELLALIKERYPALTDPRQLTFGGYTITPDGLGQLLEVVDRSGRSTRAVYLVVREAGGAWKVNGCMAVIGGGEAQLAA